MSAITAEILPESAAVRLSINAAAGIRSITRTDANGINDVRTGGGVLDVVPTLVFAGTNRIKNPSFETSAAVDYAGTGVTLYQDNYVNGIYAGMNGLRVAITGGVAGTYVRQIIDVVPGEWVSWNAHVRTKTGSRYFMQRLFFMDAAGNSVGGTISNRYYGYGAPNGGYAYTVSGQAPAGAVTAQLRLAFYGDADYLTAPADGTEWYTDGWVASGASTQAQAEYIVSEYFDGSYSPSIEFKTAWTGTPGASTSTRTTPDTPFVVTDYEPASGPIRYDVVDNNGRVESLDVTGFTLDGPWLFTPVIPGYSRRAHSVTGIDTSFEDLSTIHSGLLGRTDPIVIMQPMGLRSGTMEIYAGSYPDALEILSPLRRATVMMLRQPEHAGMDMYFAAAGGQPSIIHLSVDKDKTLWGVRVPYVEVKRPEGDLAGALGWTFADLTASAARFADLPRLFATFADMRLNARKTP